MKFITSESIIQTGNEQKLITELFQGFHLLSYVNDEFKLSEVTSINEIETTENDEVVYIKNFNVQFSVNHPIVVKNEDDTIIVAAFKPDNDNVVTFNVDNHRIFNGESWVKIDDYEIIKYDGYGYDLTSKEGNFFLNSLLMSN